MSVTTPGTGLFTVRVPPSWYEFDIWRATRTGDLGRLVDERIAGQPQLKALRGPLVKALREAAEQAERQGAVLCAATTEPVGENSLLAAVLTVFRTTGADDPALNTVDAIAAQITAIAPTPGQSAWRRVELLDVAVGRVVRVYGIDTARVGNKSLDCVVMQTLIPAPDGSTFNVVLISPQTDLTEPMLDLFDAISGTFTWTSQPTTEGA